MDTCMLCKSSKKDDIQYGEFLKNKKFGVHTFCLYLSSNLSQNGEDDEGFLGFLEADIKQEVKRISLLKCCYCQKKYANIGCCERKCRRTFHFICGLENNAENQFCHDFRSYCHSHVRKVRQRPSSKETCLICYDNLCNPNEKFNIVNMILTPCCQNGWFHKLCLQKFAKTAGYFFKCPLCNDSKIFRDKLPARGIFIPNQDAAWELEPNAFAELLERPSECAAQECKNKKGRKATSDNNPFVMCSTCGSTAMHRQCLSNGRQRFHCADCTVALEEGDSGRESLNMQQDEEDEDIDVCHVSDKEDFDIINRLFSGSGENKRDSGSHDYHTDNSDDDDDMPLVNRSVKRNKKISESSISSSENNDIQSAKSVNTRRLRSDSESSKSIMDSDDDVITKPKSCISLRRRISESSEDDNMLEESETEECIKPCKVKETRRLRTDTETTTAATEDEIMPSSQRNPRRIKTDSECSTASCSSNSKVKERNNKNSKENETEQKTKVKNRRSSSEEEIIKLPTKRKTSTDLCQAEDDEEVPLKLKKVNNAKQNDSLVSEDSEEDDDPLENFSKIVEKQKNISCIALRTRNSISNQHPNPGISGVNKENENNENQAKQLTNSKRSSKCVTLKDENSRDNNLDVSCIAKRTRRKSMYADGNTCQQKQAITGLKVGASRRKTICAEPMYSQKSLYEISQIYEKVHETDEEKDEETETDNDSDSEMNEVLVDTDLDNFIVDDDYEEKDNKFEISCIANRTRKRQSMKLDPKRLSTLEEDEDSCSSSASSYTSCNSATSSTSSTSTSSNSNNINMRLRCSRRISSDEFEEPQKDAQTSIRTRQTKSISPTLLLDKLPQHNFTAFLKPKTMTKVSSSNVSQNNYHPSPNHYRPHCNNRKRF